MKTGKGVENVQFNTQVDHPDYRNLFHVLRKSEGPVSIAVDPPYSRFDKDISRDEWMARSILLVFDTEPAAKMLVIVDSLHTLKKLEWEEHVTNKR